MIEITDMYIYIILDIHDIPPTSIPQKFKKRGKNDPCCGSLYEPARISCENWHKNEFFCKGYIYGPNVRVSKYGNLTNG